MTKLKDLALKYLKQDSSLRAIILSEPDQLPRYEAIEKIKIFSKLLQKELAAAGGAG